MTDEQNEQKLAAVRQHIDAIDVQLVRLLNERARLALRAGILKNDLKGDRAIYRPEREAQILDAVSALSKGPLSGDGLQTIFRSIITVCRTIQQTK